MKHKVNINNDNLKAQLTAASHRCPWGQDGVLYEHAEDHIRSIPARRHPEIFHHELIALGNRRRQHPLTGINLFFIVLVLTA
ncbi:hypothetical protein Y032_0029g1872 [Ancylostoma ceylanicum]|nr:hypothetical protein Y032_0029g1872 [Ancylostoma ceylanicum]